MINQKITLTDPLEGNYFYKEAMKTLRTNLQFSGKNYKTIVVTSAQPGEGKSNICFHLAVEMAKTGKKVLLVDADMRRSSYLSRYEIPEKVNGLSQYLSGQVEKLNELVCRTNYENMYMILSGPYAPNPTEMLGDAQFEEMLKATRQVYDYVFVDAPPLGPIIDAAVIGQFCDGALMVIESDTVSYRACQKIKNQLEKSGCRWLGAVLNKVDTKGSRYYGSRYGRYSYDKYKYESES